MNGSRPPLQLHFDHTPEIYATDSSGSFFLPLTVEGAAGIETGPFDEVRVVISVWHPAGNRSIDLDRAYLELRASFDPEEEHWTKIAEIEPVVPPYAGSDSFDGWIVLPILGTTSAFALYGSGFDPRARIQVRASAYLVA
jgi:hypothetical protein